MNDKAESVEVTVVPSDAIEAMERANIDVQIATAHKYPRSLERFKETALNMVTQDEDTAASCIYARPVGKNRDGSQKYAEGMSIRMAEIVASGYGNLRVGSMLIEQTPRQVKARGFAHDLESNFAATSEVVESTVDSNGNPYSERMRVVAAKACLAKARRDATFQVVPRALCKSLEDAARKTAIGDAATLEKRRGMVMEWISKLGIDKERVFAALQVAGIADVGLKQLETLTGLKTAIKEGDVSVDEAFPRLEDPNAKKGASGLVDKLKGAKAPAAEPQPEAPKQEAAPAAATVDLKVVVKALWEKSKPSKCQKACHVAGIKWDDGETYENATPEQLAVIKKSLEE